jgi:DNA repair exonuclease SbcCD nuclease subunit
MKLIIFADLHGHMHKEFVTLVDGVNSRLRDMVDVLGRIKSLATKLSQQGESVAALFLGDFFELKNGADERVIRAVFKGLADMARAKVPIGMLPGNHDYCQWGNDPALQDAMEDMYGLGNDGCIEKLGYGDGIIKTLIREQGWELFVFPFDRDPSKVMKAVDECTAGANSLAIFHQDVIGVDYGGGWLQDKGIDAAVISKKFTFSLCGHFHGHKQVTKNFVIVGSPLMHSFKEIGQSKGWGIFDLKTGQYEHIENITSPIFYDMAVGPDVSSPVVDDKNFYRITLNGEADLSGIKWKRVVPSKTADAKGRSDINLADSWVEVVRKYVALRAREDQDKERLIVLGEAYISGDGSSAIQKVTS